MSLALYFDQHVNGAIAHGLRRRGIDVVTAEEDGNKTLPDEMLLERASALGRVLISNDRDFRRIAAQWNRDGQRFAGMVVLTDQRVAVGIAVDDLLLIAEAFSAEEMVNRVEYIPY